MQESCVIDTIESEMKSLREIVNKVFEVDIMKKYRYRKFVDARMVFSKILRDRGYTVVSIAKFMKKDHTTILHYNVNFDVIITQDGKLRDRYSVCLNSFLQDREPIVQTFTDKQLYNEVKKLNEQIVNLNNQIERISNDKEMLSKMLNRKTRFDEVLNVMDEKIPLGREQLVIDSIKRMFNDL
jgi:hypothetical protein